MPAPGDQHKRITNPFQPQPQQGNAGFGEMQNQQQQRPQQPPVQRMSEYTAQEIATLQGRLERQLGPEYLSSRSGPSGQKVHYITAEKVISLANEVFGFNGWSSSIQNIQIDFVDEHPQTLKISVGLSVIVRVTLRDGAYHEDIGYGHIENCKGKAAAFEKAKKEGTTDALKRALRNFGNVLGNCIYDKTYVERVTKIKAVPVNKRGFNEQNLYRHADYTVKTEAAGASAGAGAGAAATVSAAAPAGPPTTERKTTAATSSTSVKPEVASGADASAVPMDVFDEDFLGDFDEADFCVSEEGHPDEVAVSEAAIPALGQPQRNQGSRNTSPVRQVPPQQPGPASGNGMMPRAPQTPNHINGRPNGGGFAPKPYQAAGNNQQHNRPVQAPSLQAQAAQRQQANTNGTNSGYGQRPAAPSTTANNNTAGGAGSLGEPEGTPWLSARAVAKVGDGDVLGAVAPSVQAGHLFNPKAESPSIPRTPGIDHHSSKPVPRLDRPAGAAAAIPASVAATGGAGALSSVAAPNGSAGVGAGIAGAGGITRSGTNFGISEPVRRIGAPSSTASPLANRGQFRPPPMKRGPPTDTPGGAARPPLADMPSNVSTNGGTVLAANAAGPGGAGGVDAKRQKIV